MRSEKKLNEYRRFIAGLEKPSKESAESLTEGDWEWFNTNRKRLQPLTYRLASTQAQLIVEKLIDRKKHQLLEKRDYQLQEWSHYTSLDAKTPFDSPIFKKMVADSFFKKARKALNAMKLGNFALRENAKAGAANMSRKDIRRFNNLLKAAFGFDREKALGLYAEQVEKGAPRQPFIERIIATPKA